MRLLMHLHRFASNGQHLVGRFVDGDNGGLVYNNLVFVDNKGVGSAKVYGNVAGEKIKKSHCSVVVLLVLKMYP